MGKATLKIDGDSEKAQQSIVALEKKIDKLENSLKGVSKRTKSMGSESRTTWKQITAGMLTADAAANAVSASINKVTEALRHQMEVAKQAAQQVKSSANPLGNLISMANTPEERDKLIAESKALFASGAVDTQSAAHNLTFSMVSAGLTDADKATIVKLARHQLLPDPTATVDDLSTLQTAMGANETGTFKDLVSKAFASSSATKVNMGAILSASATSGPSAVALGLSDEEVLASTAVLSKAVKSADMAATQLKALFGAMDKLGEFKGKSLEASVMDIQGRGLSGEELQKMLGSQEAINAYRLLVQNRGLYTDTLQNTINAQRIGLSDQKIKLAANTPEIAATMLQTAEVNKKELGRNDLGVKGLLADAVADSMQQKADKRGRFMASFMESMNSFDRMIMGEEAWRKYRPTEFWSGVKPNAEVNQKADQIQERMLQQQQEMVNQLKEINRKAVPPERQLRRNGD